MTQVNAIETWEATRHSSVNAAPYLRLSVFDDVWSDVSEETSKQTALTLIDSKTSI